MLFNSYAFVLVFLPVTLLVFFSLGRWSPPWARLFLLFASFAFYGYWDIFYLGLLIVSILANYGIGAAITRLRTDAPDRAKKIMLAGVAANVALLAYYKYTTFIVDNVSVLTGYDYTMHSIVLPLAISFYTFQQIAYLIDTWRSQTRPYTLVDYALFVTFFPQLIAGPIVHHADIIPQIENPRTYRFRPRDFAVGLCFFIIGLAKKLLIADTVGVLADPVFDGALVNPPTMAAAWTAVLAFSIGLYFDFSGYSDMAVGLARMFGIRVAYNFASPYQSTSIVDFWKRWHITLSSWLRDFLYIPLGGNRRGRWRRHLNLMITMLVGGLWHGAGWTFVIWGGLHGLYLIVNHRWRHFTEIAAARGRPIVVSPVLGWAITMGAVGFAWIFFRAPTLDHAGVMIVGLLGLNPLPPSLPPETVASAVTPLLERPWNEIAIRGLRRFAEAYPEAVLLVGAGIALFLPNSQEILDRPEGRRPLMPRLSVPTFRPTHTWAAATAFLLLVALSRMSDVKAFVYFQF